MKRKIAFFLGGILILTFLSFSKKNNILYHEISYTATSLHLEKWNITDTTHVSFVKEIVDDQGRTKELRFYNSFHKLDWPGSAFLGGPIIRYDYLDNQIIETFYSADNEIANDFRGSEVPYRHIYFLNEENQIIDYKEIYKIDFELTQESFDETIKHLTFYKNLILEYDSLFTDSSYQFTYTVFGYEYAYAKMNGVNPQGKKQH